MTQVGKGRQAGNQFGQQDGSSFETWTFDTAALGAFSGFSDEGTLSDGTITNRAAPLAGTYQQIVFIEGNVPDARELAAGAGPGVLAIILNPEQDGVDQIAAFLSSHNISGLSGIDVVAHGLDGQVELGSATLSAATLGQYQPQLATIGAALAPNGAIQIYGCDVAQDAAGSAFLDQLSAAAGGVSIAAASHLVGAASGGGSWDLNVQTGADNAASPFTQAAEANYPAELAVSGYLYYGLTDQSATTASATDAIVKVTTADTGSTTVASAFADQVTALALDVPDNVMFVLDTSTAVQSSPTAETVWSVNLTSGAATKIYTISTADGTLSNAFGYDSLNGSLYFIAGSKLMSINSSGGNYQTVTTTAISADSALGLALDPAQGLGFVIDTGAATRDIYSINLSTGVETKIYQDTSLPLGAGLEYDPANNELYFLGVKSAGDAALYEISTDPGSVLASPTLVVDNAQTTSTGASGIAIDPANGIAYIRDAINSNDYAINEVNLSTGSVSTLLTAATATQLSVIFQPATTTAFSAATSSPANGATGVAESAKITLGFTGPVYQGTTGTISVVQVSNGNVVETLGVSSTRISGWGTSSIAIASAGNLPPGQLAVEWTSNAFVDEIGNSVPANASTSTEAFTVVVCFCAGTLIDTPAGEVQVQALKIGDIVTTVHNGPSPVKWVGKGRVLATRGKRTAATPVIVRKGALADNVPHKDLHVTKAHSLYIDGVLIPVEFLVNHKTILWDDRAQEVEIYHVELEDHDILLANGVPAESFRNDGNRWLFQNAWSGWDLPPQEPCAPVLTGGPVVDAVWRRLLDRAGPRALPPLTDDPDVHLIVDGVRVDATESNGSVLVFRMPGRPGSVRIASRDTIPEELGIARDPRSLGIALRRIVVRQGTRFVLIGADDARLTDGFHDYEPAGNLRWTNGDAELPAALLAGCRSGSELVLHLAGTARYPLFHEERAAA
jgi:methionine-rich copper-binding protein CopC